MAKRRYYFLIGVIILVMTLLGLLIPDQTKELYDNEFTLFVVVPLSLIAAWAVFQAGKESRQ